MTFIDDGKTKINTSTWEQCGRAVAKLFSLPIYPEDEHDKSLTISHWKNDAVHIQSFFVNQQDMFASMLRVTGDKESDWTIEYQNAQERYKQGQEWLKEGGAKVSQNDAYNPSWSLSQALQEAISLVVPTASDPSDSTENRLKDES